ncbi:T-cell-specific surface glycoprotein CD28 isoform 2-T2 [Discoglossus pictus]
MCSGGLFEGISEKHAISAKPNGLWSHVCTLSFTMNLWIVLIPSYISLVRCTDGSSGNNRTSVLIAYKSISITYYSTFEGKTKEFRVLLRRGTNNARTVCEGSFNSSYQPFQCSTDISCTVIPTNTSVTFNLMGLTEAHTDIYYFFKNNMYPPPYTCSRDNGTVIHVKTDEHLLSEPVPPTKPHVSQPSWPLLVMLIVSAVYSVFVTGALCYILRRGRKTRILQSEYINVVPRRPKHHHPYAPTPVHSRSR